MTMQHRWRPLEPGQVSRVCVLDVVTGESTVVLETDRLVLEAPNWHPTRPWLVLNGEGGLFVLDLGSPVPGLVEIPTGGERLANNDHVLSPDGELVYHSTITGEIHVVPTTGGVARRVSNVHADPFRYYLHGISPDGNVLAYVGHDARPEENTFEVWTLDLRTGEDRRLTRTGRHHDGAEFTADGTRLLFNSEREATVPGHAQLFSSDLDGGDVRQLTDDERVNWFPHQSPDGTLLAYLSYPPGTTGHPANLPVDLRLWDPSGNHRVLVSTFGGQGTINVPSWAPDSRRLAYVDYPIHAR